MPIYSCSHVVLAEDFANDTLPRTDVAWACPNCHSLAIHSLKLVYDNAQNLISSLANSGRAAVPPDAHEDVLEVFHHLAALSTIPSLFHQGIVAALDGAQKRILEIAFQDGQSPDRTPSPHSGADPPPSPIRFQAQSTGLPHTQTSSRWLARRGAITDGVIPHGIVQQRVQSFTSEAPPNAGIVLDLRGRLIPSIEPR